jgi:hypothetical protein
VKSADGRDAGCDLNPYDVRKSPYSLRSNGQSVNRQVVDDNFTCIGEIIRLVVFVAGTGHTGAAGTAYFVMPGQLWVVLADPSNAEAIRTVCSHLANQPCWFDAADLSETTGFSSARQDTFVGFRRFGGRVRTLALGL